MSPAVSVLAAAVVVTFAVADELYVAATRGVKVPKLGVAEPSDSDSLTGVERHALEVAQGTHRERHRRGCGSTYVHLRDLVTRHRVPVFLTSKLTSTPSPDGTAVSLENAKVV